MVAPQVPACLCLLAKPGAPRRRLVAAPGEQFAEGARLEAEIRTNLKAVGRG